jgi:hypothetical protein
MMLLFNNLPRYIKSTSFTTPAPERACLGAELLQLYAEGKHAEIAGPRGRPACPRTKRGISSPTGEKSDVVHDLLAFLAERVLEMNKQKLARRSK